MENQSYQEYIQHVLLELNIPSTIAVERGLVLYEEAKELVIIATDLNGRMHHLEPTAAHAWLKMNEAVKSQNIDLYVVSAFRSVSRQAEIIQGKLDRGLPLNQILKVSALPGYSEHHTGCAIDLATAGSPPLEVEFEQTSSFDWLTRHANSYGFFMSYPRNNLFGYEYEPWHWCYKGLVSESSN